MRIDTLGRIWPPDDWEERAAIPDAAWRAAARALAGTGWQGGWRLNGSARVRLTAEGETWSLRVTPPGEEAEPEMVVDGDTAHVDVAGRSIAFSLAPAPDVDRAARAATAHTGGGPVEIVAPMPGSILVVHASAGGAVAAGDPVFTLEAMKMEHGVTAPIAGRVAELRARTGDQVARGDVLAVVEP
jgi:biotin carboxyl carrier protein